MISVSQRDISSIILITTQFMTGVAGVKAQVLVKRTVKQVVIYRNTHTTTLFSLQE